MFDQVFGGGDFEGDEFDRQNKHPRSLFKNNAGEGWHTVGKPSSTGVQEIRCDFIDYNNNPHRGAGQTAINVVSGLFEKVFGGNRPQRK